MLACHLTATQTVWPAAQSHTRPLDALQCQLSQLPAPAHCPFQFLFAHQGSKSIQPRADAGLSASQPDLKCPPTGQPFRLELLRLWIQDKKFSSSSLALAEAIISPERKTERKQ